jgi:hypothetical protein
MKYPERQPRDEPSLEKYTYYDNEKVIQDDGRISLFTWNNKQKDKGWIFDCYVDKNDFHILTEESQNSEFVKLLIKSEFPLTEYPIEFSTYTLEDDEQLHAYRYGSIMSERGGYYITPKNNNFKILKIKQTWLS